MKLIVFCCLILLCSFNVLASPERYRVVRDQDGNALKIIDISLGKKNDLISFTSQVRNDIKILVGQDLFDDHEVARELFSKNDLTKLEKKFKKYQKRISKYDIDSFFDDKRMGEILDHFQEQLDLVRSENYQTIVHLSDSFYFTKEEIYTRAIRSTKTLAKTLINGGVFLNLVTYILDQYISNLMEAKAYHQHMLLAWLSFDRRDIFKLTRDELRRARSSIMESRLNVWNLFSILSIKDDFAGFYESVIKKVRNKSRKRMRKNADRYSGRVDYLNDFHGWWTERETGHRQIVNLYRKKSYFSSSHLLPMILNVQIS